jgi:hypothetical protein
MGVDAVVDATIMVPQGGFMKLLLNWEPDGGVWEAAADTLGDAGGAAAAAGL